MRRAEEGMGAGADDLPAALSLNALLNAGWGKVGHNESLTQAITADEALQRLMEGHERFLRGEARFPSLQREVLASLAKGQRPFATILGCSDSRVPPELIFDAGLGELFVVRVAGNVMSAEVAGSIQYAMSHLMTPLLLVLGHEGCGAIKAALETKFQGAKQRSRIQVLVDELLPGLTDVDPQMEPGLQLVRAVESNVRWTMRHILESPEGQDRLREGRIKLVGGVYELETGKVRFLE
jgi:carbonic anhydrase